MDALSLRVTLVAALVLCVVVADATEVAKEHRVNGRVSPLKEHDIRAPPPKEEHPRKSYGAPPPKEQRPRESYGAPPKENEYRVAMPLYRVKSKPGVLIPESKIQTISRNSALP